MKLISILALVLLGCSNRPLPEVTQLQSSVSADDFALSAIGGLIKNGMSDPSALEKEINKPGDDNPYTRVDVDKDGQRDVILVKEVVPREQLEFVAHPNSGEDQSIAKATFSVDNGNVVYNANYTSYVNGYNNPQHIYHDTFARDLAFALWMTSITRPVYIGSPIGYTSYRVMPRDRFVTHQTTTFQQSRINPTPVAPKSSIDQSRFTSKATPPRSSSFTGATSGMSSIRKDNGSSVAKGAFDNSSRSTTSSRPSSSFSSPSRSSSSSSSFRSSSSSSSSRSRGR